jgi:hypothetical protein
MCPMNSAGTTMAVRTMTVNIPASPEVECDKNSITLGRNFATVRLDIFFSSAVAFAHHRPGNTNCRVSSVVEQRFCKPLVGSSNLSPGTSACTNERRAMTWVIARLPQPTKHNDQ